MPRKNGLVHADTGRQQIASMRPRPDAAEKRYREREIRLVMLSFNEAAARCRGKTADAAHQSTTVEMLQ